MDRGGGGDADLVGAQDGRVVEGRSADYVGAVQEDEGCVVEKVEGDDVEGWAD